MFIMFRSTHEVLMRKQQEAHDKQVETLRKHVEKHLEDKESLHAKLEAQKKITSTIRVDKIEKGFGRPVRDMADTLIREMYEMNKMIFEFPNWDSLPEEYRDAVYNLMYKLLGRPRKSSQKSTRK